MFWFFRYIKRIHAGTRNQVSVYLGREIDSEYTWDAKSILGIPGTRNRFWVYLEREIKFQYTWDAK